MAAPTKRGSTAPATGLAVTSPAGTAIGDLVVVVTWERAGAGSPTHTLQQNFVEIRTWAHNDGSTDGTLSVAYKIATASGAQSYQAYTTDGSGTVRTGCVVFNVDTFDVVNTTPAQNASSGTTNAAPDPPSITGLTGDFVILAIGAWHLGSAATVAVTAPTNYTEEWECAGSQDVELSLALRSLTGLSSSTEDPGAFADDVAPNGTARMTIGIRGSYALTASAEVTTATATALGPTVTPGGVSASADVTTATSTALDPTVTPGGVNVSAALNTLTSSALDATVEQGSGGLTADAEVTTATATALGPTVTPGPVSVSADVSTATATALGPTVTPGPVSVSADLSTATATALGPTVTPGPVSVSAALNTVTSSALDATVSNGVNVDAEACSLTATAMAATVAPGAVTASADVTVATASALGATVTPGGVSVSADVAVATATALGATVIGAQEAAADVAVATATALAAGVMSDQEISADVTLVSVTALPATGTLPSLFGRCSRHCLAMSNRPDQRYEWIYSLPP